MFSQRFVDDSFLEEVYDSATCSVVSVQVEEGFFVDVPKGQDAIVKVRLNDNSCIRWCEGRAGKQHYIRAHADTNNVRVIRSKAGPMMTLRCFMGDPTEHQPDIACFRGHALTKQYGTSTSSWSQFQRRSKPSTCCRCDKEIHIDALKLTCAACDYSLCCSCFESRPSWQFQTDTDGLWSFILLQDVSKLEAKYTQDPAGVVPLVLGSKNWKYSVDFSSMTQTNPRNNTQRSLRRVGGAHVKSVAERRKELEEKEQEQQRRAEEAAERIRQEEAKRKKVEAKKKAEADAKRKAKAKMRDDDSAARLHSLDHIHAETAAAANAEAIKSDTLFCSCCSRPRMADDAEADMPVQYEYDTMLGRNGF